jgi:hypothetical protein
MKWTRTGPQMSLTNGVFLTDFDVSDENLGRIISVRKVMVRLHPQREGTAI